MLVPSAVTRPYHRGTMSAIVTRAPRDEGAASRLTPAPATASAGRPRAATSTRIDASSAFPVLAALAGHLAVVLPQPFGLGTELNRNPEHRFGPFTQGLAHPNHAR